MSTAAKDMAVAQDISDAVAKLAEKLVVAQSILTNRDSSKTSKQRDLEEKLAHSLAELDDVKATKLALERRLEGSKNALRVSRDEVAALTVEIEVQKSKIDELKQTVVEAEKKVVSSADNVLSEVQVLEEENIELMRENKELRVEVSRYRSLAANSIADLPFAPSRPVAAPIPASPLIQQIDADGLALLSGRKRTFGTDLSNSQPMRDLTNVDAVDLAGSSQKKALPVDPNSNKQRRMRMRAKALVDDIAAPAQDEAGECKQS